MVATTIAVTSSVSSLALAQAQNTSRPIAKNESMFIDGKALTVTTGIAKDDVSAQVARLGAHDIGPGAIIFRANDKLYIVDAPPLPFHALNDQDRQRSYGGLNDDRQRSYGGLNDDRQLSYGGLTDAELARLRGMLYDPALRHLRTYLNDIAIRRQRAYGLYDPNNDRQRSYGGLNDDRQRSYGGLNERQQSYGGVYDPDYINYKLKKTFDEVWGSGAAVPATPSAPAAGPTAPADKK